MIQLTVLGIFFIGFGSFGNRANHKKSWLTVCALLISTAVIILTTIVPFFVVSAMKNLQNLPKYLSNMMSFASIAQALKTQFFDTTGNKDYAEADGTVDEYDRNENVGGAFYVLSLTLGFVLLSFLIVDLGVVIIPSEWLAKNPFISNLSTPASLWAESVQKRAASFKVTKMLLNALSLHRSTEHPTVTSGTSESKAAYHAELYAHAISNYHAQESKTEKVGGVFWAWRRILDGRIFSEEGIWLHSRLVVGNFLQLLVLSL
jgi:hypothetical protein